ncbi:T6SS effector BTH_I2691 family protein [Chromobacterium haemolyticum]|uniref:T6SS effector BTH_I2691 family protein n=1 Tax=Chromobacterium haemolyticum TaxID=394935 RepID=UPI0009DA3AF6|nr:T6SS effector BTH_I2691 family protein [Chromobacterium haemolyticum]OQS43862.1 hypothetical protein B0T39_02550 [Chromobacterium haemolyticum]
MSKPECTQQKTCDYCEKRGVPILPLRYAVAMPNAGAPKPASPPSIALPAASGQYTLRLLRSGYLYVYDEARKRWDDYFVTADGYFCKIFPVKGQPTPIPSKAFNCCDPSHRALASCITIPDAKRATKVWLGFSDAQWTDDVRKRHESADYRKQHMRCVDVNAYTAGADGKHCLPIKNVGAKVSEYALDDAALKKALSFSPHQLDSRKKQTAMLLAQCEQLMPGKGFAVALTDPVGIASELSSLMDVHAHAFANAPSRKHPLMAASAIRQIKNEVHAQALKAEQNAAEELADQQLMEYGALPSLFPSLRKKQEELDEQIRTVTPQQIKTAQTHAWKRYHDQFNEDAMDAWYKGFEAESQVFHQQTIAPLAKAHVSWMDTAGIKKYFECNFDPKNMDSGDVYIRTAHLVVKGVQDKKECQEHIADQIMLKFTADNYLLNAVVFNQATLKEQVNKLLGGNALDHRGFPADALIGFHTTTAAKVLTEAQAGEVSSYLVAINGALVRAFTKAVDGVGLPIWAALAKYSGQVFIRVEVSGRKKAFISQLIKEVLKLSGQATRPPEIKRAVQAELRTLQVAGIKLEGKETKQFIVVVDPAHIKGMPANLSPAQQASWLAKSIRTADQIDNLVFGSWRQSLLKPEAVLKGHIPFIGGLLAALWQLAALKKLAEDNDSAMSHEEYEPISRLAAGALALLGTMGDLIGQGLEKMAVKIPSLGQGFAKRARWLGTLGRVAGFIGAGIMAAFDGHKAWIAYNNRQFGMMGLYIGSTLLGVYIGYLALGSGIPFVGWLAIIALLSITLIIELVKDNKLQEWMQNGFWGKKTYKTPEEEKQQLDLALKG